MIENKQAIKLSTVFMGTSSLSEKILSDLIDAGYNIVAVYTKPDKKTGRDQEVTESPVKQLAQKHNIPVVQPQKFTDDVVSELKKFKADLILVAAYGKILPKAVLEIPGFGCVNVHPSLLPKFRGPSPIQNTLLLGEKETGTTIMLMDEGMDTGQILAQQTMAIDDNDTNQSLTEKLAALSSELLLKTIPLWIDRKIEAEPQDNAKATLCQLIEREDGKIFWEENAEIIFNRYRALFPWPGVFTFWKNNDAPLRLKLLKISLQRLNSQKVYAAGQVFQLGDKIGVQTLNGIIILEEVQLEGKKAVSIADFVNGYPNFVGSILN